MSDDVLLEVQINPDGSVSARFPMDADDIVRLWGSGNSGGSE